MQFELLATTSLALNHQLMWIWYSEQMKSFVVGDDKSARAISVDDPNTTTPLNAAPQSHNLPIPVALFDEFKEALWHGFHFVDSPNADLLRTIVFGPDYGNYVEHPASGLILSLRSGAVELFDRVASDFKLLDKTRARGKAALAFAAHPTESSIAYGDNFGVFHLHRFDKTGFGKATKIADKTRKASRLEFSRDGTTLLLGGMGYLASYSYANGKFSLLHEVSVPVRDFIWREKEKLILVNQGLHGLAAYRLDGQGFTKLADVPSEIAIHQMAISDDLSQLACTLQGSQEIKIFRIA